MTALAARWTAARFRMQIRNPRAAVFTVLFPLIMLVLFSALYGNSDVDAYGHKVRYAQFYAPSIAIFSLVTACYTTLVVALANARDQGLLKRVRGTPLPMGLYLAAWVAGAAGTGLFAVLLLFAVAVPAFGVDVDPAMLPAALLTLLLGAACLSALGVAVAAVVKDADQALPVAQITFLPVSLISGIWFPLDGAPDWLVTVAHVFPVAHIVEAFGGCFTPGRTFDLADLAVVALWTAAAVLVAVRRFRWEP